MAVLEAMSPNISPAAPRTATPTCRPRPKPSLDLRLPAGQRGGVFSLPGEAGVPLWDGEVVLGIGVQMGPGVNMVDRYVSCPTTRTVTQSGRASTP